MGRCGLTSSPASHQYSSTVSRRFRPSLCILLSPNLPRWPGSRQADQSRLLWFDQSERKSTDGHLRPQVLHVFRFPHSQKSLPVLLCIKLVFCCSRHSLVALEVDSEEDSVEPKSLLSPLSSDVDKSEDRMETARPSPDLPCTRSQSASACEPTVKVKTTSQDCTLILPQEVLCSCFKLLLSFVQELGDQGIRLRSYSYSSSKISLRPARFTRDNHASEISPGQWHRDFFFSLPHIVCSHA